MSRRKSLSTQVWESLSERIGSGALAPGAQLPTEAVLCAEYSVSRTVVREAIARLRSEGRVIPQQGRGVFVSEAPAQLNFQITDTALQSLAETVALLELRLSIETEAAGLCAERCSEAQAADIRTLMDQVDSVHAELATSQIHYDYDFHLKIAQGSDNAFMLAFLEYLRPLIVPHFRLEQIVWDVGKEAYYAGIHVEHERIVTAIEARNPTAARTAMRRHLVNSLGRVRALAAASGARPDGAEVTKAAKALFTTPPSKVDPR